MIENHLLSMCVIASQCFCIIDGCWEHGNSIVPLTKKEKICTSTNQQKIHCFNQSIMLSNNIELIGNNNTSPANPSTPYQPLMSNCKRKHKLPTTPTENQESSSPQVNKKNVSFSANDDNIIGSNPTKGILW